jgi:hypothetical protein
VKPQRGVPVDAPNFDELIGVAATGSASRRDLSPLERPPRPPQQLPSNAVITLGNAHPR